MPKQIYTAREGTTTVEDLPVVIVDSTNQTEFEDPESEAAALAQLEEEQQQ